MDKTDGGFDEAMFAKRFNQFRPEYGPHFTEVYGYMRANCPIAHTDELGGFWVITRYKDIARVALDSETFSSSYGVFTSPTDPQPLKRGFGPLDAERTGVETGITVRLASVCRLQRSHVLLSRATLSFRSIFRERNRIWMGLRRDRRCSGLGWASGCT